MSTGAKYSNQNTQPQEPTVTEKSSGLDYIESSIEPSNEGVGARKNSTKNDGKGAE